MLELCPFLIQHICVFLDTRIMAELLNICTIYTAQYIAKASTSLVFLPQTPAQNSIQIYFVSSLVSSPRHQPRISQIYYVSSLASSPRHQPRILESTMFLAQFLAPACQCLDTIQESLLQPSPSTLQILSAPQDLQGENMIVKK